jgi:hypothetical protein
MQTTKRVLPVEELHLCLAPHVCKAADDGSGMDDGDPVPPAPGVTWPELQDTILVRRLPFVSRNMQYSVLMTWHFFPCNTEVLLALCSDISSAPHVGRYAAGM